MARTNRSPKMRLGELLVAAGLLSEDKVRIGLEEQRRNNLFLGEALVQLGFVSEEAIAQAIIQHFNLPFISASQFAIPPDVFNLFPVRMYHEYQFIAVDKLDMSIIIVAAGPINQDMMEELERVSQCRIYHYVSTWRDISAAIEKNSKDIGGQAQVELTGLGSMLLETPKFDQPNKSGIAKVTREGSSANIPGISMPSSIRAPLAAPPKTSMSSANLSALLSPLGMGAKNSNTQPVSVRPPTARLTAFLKVTPGASSGGLSAIKSGQFQALNISSAPNVSPTAMPQMSPTSIPAVPPPNANGGQGHPEDPNLKPKAPSFLTPRKS